MTAIINKRKCPAQEQVCKAIPACPSDAIYYQVDATEPLGGMIVVDEKRCSSCGACVEACCGQAIELA